MSIISSDDIERAIGREQVRAFVKDEIGRSLINMTYDEIKYCEADVAFILDAYKRNKKLLNAQYGCCSFTSDIYKMAAEKEKVEFIKGFFSSWYPRTNEVLFILFKDGRHNYYDYIKFVKDINDDYLYIENIDGCYEKIKYSDIEDLAVGVKNPGESALSAIPDWFENRINKYTGKLKEEQKMKDNWYLYYTKNLNGDDTVLIAQKLDDAIALCKERNFDLPVYMTEADSRDKYVKASDNGCSILTVTEGADGTSCFTTKKYASEIKKVKENSTMKNYIWNLYYTRTKLGQDRIIIARTLDDATRYAESRYEVYSTPVWLCEADEHDKYARCSVYGASTLWTTYKGNEYIGDKVAVSGVEKYADAIAYIKHKLGIDITPTGSIEVRYEDGHKTVYDNVEKYEESTSVFGVKSLYITESTGKRISIPLTWVKEYVVDMPNDKKVVKEKITLGKEELESIIAEMKALEEKLKKIKEG